MISALRQTWRTPITRAVQCHGRLLSTATLLDPNPELVDARQAPSDYVKSSASVYRDFATEEEAKVLVEDIQSIMKR